MNETVKTVLTVLVVAAMLVLLISIGSSMKTVREVNNYKLEAWAAILCFIAFLVIYYHKKSIQDVKVIVPDKAIKIYVDVHANGNQQVIPTPMETMAENVNAISTQEIDIKKVKPWGDLNIGDMNLDGEEI